MNDIIHKLKIRYTKSYVLIAAILLAVIMGAIIGAFILVSNIRIDNSLKSTLSSNKGINPTMRTERCMEIRIVGDHAIYSGFDMYSTDAEEIVKEAIEVSEGTFKYSNNYFKVSSIDELGSKHYAVYDFTVERENRMNVFWASMFAYIAALGVVAVIGWNFSKRTTKPVEEAFEKQKELIANASHELKTPLTVISTDLDIVQSDPTKTVEENKKWFESMNLLVGRMDSLILDMLELSKLDSNANKIVLTDVNLSDLIKGCYLEFEAHCFEKNIKIDLELEDNIHVIGEEKSIDKVVTILVDNAIKYTLANNGIILKAIVDGATASIIVRNSGSGIKKENLTKIFERFFKEDTSRSGEDHSFGLGLSIAKSTVEQMNGKIRCESDGETYTEFIVDLPLSKKEQK